MLTGPEYRRCIRSAVEAMSIALPGSISQPNMARAGFQTLYTRVKFERTYSGGDATGN